MLNALDERKERFAYFRRKQRGDAKQHRDYERIIAAKVAAASAPEVLMKKALIAAFGKARAGSKRRRIEFDIKIANVLILAAKTNYRCAVTGLPLSLDRTVGWYRRPFAPSIDRINSARGYTEGNIRVVCCAVNIALGEWGESVFDVIAKAYVGRLSNG